MSGKWSNFSAFPSIAPPNTSRLYADCERVARARLFRGQGEHMGDTAETGTAAVTTSKYGFRLEWKRLPSGEFVGDCTARLPDSCSACVPDSRQP